MKKHILFLILSILISNISFGQKTNEGTFSKLDSKADHIEWRSKLKTPAWIAFKSEVSVSPQEVINSLLSDNMPAGNSLANLRSEPDDIGYVHQTFVQKFGSIKVEGGEYKLSVSPRGVTYASGYLFPIEAIPSVAISEIQALNHAIKFKDAITYKWEILEEEQLLKNMKNDPSATYFPTAELIILPKFEDDKYHYRVAYKFDIYTHEPVDRAYVYVDATTGEVLQSIPRIYHTNGTGNTMYNGTQSFNTEHHNNEFRLRQNVPVGNTHRKVVTLDLNQGTNFSAAVDFVDADNNWVHTTNQDDAGWSAHWAAEKTWDYYYEVLGRNSFDNQGGTINQFVHYRTAENNAYWDGERMLYGDGDGIIFRPLVSVDVCGHEVTHGVTDRSSGLLYQNESGALNESFSDIFGTAVEFFVEGSQGDFDIGEDFTINNSHGIRSMSDPKSFSDPDTYQGQYWAATSAFPNLANDYGGVHTNSGVQNYWFYLLSVGGSGVNDIDDAYTVAGIGIDKAAKIAFRNNTTKLSANSNFADARAGAIASCIELYGAGTPEEKAVMDAWYAVGVGAAYNGNIDSCPVPQGLFVSEVTENSAMLSWSTIYNAISYTVVYRESGSTLWNSINTTNPSLHLTGLIGNTNYEFQVSTNCNGESSTFSQIQSFATLNPNAVPYCESEGESSYNSWINSIAVGDLTNLSNNNNGYFDYTHLVVSGQQGGVLDVSLTPGHSTFPFSQYWRIWIDINRDGDFYDPGELAFDSGSTSSSTITGSLSISGNALVGPTRMRIQMKSSQSSEPCELISSGEVEDYTINITSNDAEQCNPPLNGQTTNVTTNSANLNWNAVSMANVYILRFREEGQTWDSLTTTATSYTLSNLTEDTNHEWTVRSVCGSDEESENTNQFSFTTLSNNPTVCPAPGNLQTTLITTSSALLSWDASQSATGYILKYRAVGQNFDSLSLSDTQHNLTELNEDTDYEWTVRTDCGNGNESANAAIQSFTTVENNPVTEYCDSQGNNASSEWIGTVTIGDLTNNSGQDNGYGDYTNLVVSAEQGNIINFSLTPYYYLFYNSVYWKIWADYNHDGDFDDAGELAYDAGSTSTNTRTGSFTIPNGATIGDTRLRVQMKFSTAPSACENFDRGEVEDYTLTIFGSSLNSIGAPQNEQVIHSSVRQKKSSKYKTLQGGLELELYPNPATDIVHIKASEEFDHYQIRDLHGRMVQNGNLNTIQSINVSNLPKGVYVVVIEGLNLRESKRLVIR